MTSYKGVLEVIRRHKSFLVSSHQNPDADAISSSLVLGLYLKSIGKKVTVVNEDACPLWLKFLPAASMLKSPSAAARTHYDAVIVVDCGDLDRIGKVKGIVPKGVPLINIDHHVTNDRFGTVNVVDAKASSSCEMVYDLLKAAGYRLDKKTAMLLYAGIMTDTGSFRYDNTSARSHAVVEELMAFPISASKMYERLYVGIPVGDMKLFTDVIHQSQLFEGNRVYCVSLTKKTVSRFSKSFDLKEKLFNFLRSVDGIEVVVILTEIGPREVRVNLRSQNDFDVALLAGQFDGGGHKKASGCKIHSSLSEARKKIVKAIRARLGRS